LWVDDAALKAITVPASSFTAVTIAQRSSRPPKSRFPNLQFKKIEGAGHGPAMQSPEFPKDIREFLDHQMPKPVGPSLPAR